LSNIAVCAVFLIFGALMHSPAEANAFDSLKSLKKTDKMPFVLRGHGPPMNAIEGSESRRS
jgi:hypothetical protein